MDKQCIYQLVSHHTGQAYVYSSLLFAIKALLGKEWHINIHHISREANQAADFMANYAFIHPLGLHIFSSPPPELANILVHDMYRILYPLSV